MKDIRASRIWGLLYRFFYLLFQLIFCSLSLFCYFCHLLLSPCYKSSSDKTFIIFFYNIFQTSPRRLPAHVDPSLQFAKQNIELKCFQPNEQSFSKTNPNNSIHRLVWILSLVANMQFFKNSDQPTLWKWILFHSLLVLGGETSHFVFHSSPCTALACLNLHSVRQLDKKIFQ